jgi:hypothetical protein
VGTLAAKLQLKPGQSIAVVHRPDGVELDLPEATAGAADGVLAFVGDSAELDEVAATAFAAAARDELAWIAYPKAGLLGTDLNRDRLAERVRARGLRPVRQVSIDDVWSALRFRPA